MAESTDHILEQVVKALDEFDDRTLEVSVRRTMRIASLMGDSKDAIRLSLELKPIGGSREANKEQILKLLNADERENWGKRGSPEDLALKEYIEDRQEVSKGYEDESNDESKFLAHEISSLEHFLELYKTMENDVNIMKMVHIQNKILTMIRNRTYTLLCAYERQLSFSKINDDIYAAYRKRVDAMLLTLAPNVIEQFNAVYRRLRDAKNTDSTALNGEVFTHALTSCRRILKTVVDYVQPPDGSVNENGVTLNDEKYRARLSKFIKEKSNSKSTGETKIAIADNLYGRFEKLDNLTSKGVHENVDLEQAELCAIDTYIVAGEVLRLAEEAKEV
jgi:hypothetical protein